MAAAAAFTIYDVAGLCGVAAYIGAYFSVQVGYMRSSSTTYSVLNLLGPLLILVSLSDAFNLASFVSQAFWLVITLLGLARRKWHSPAPK